MSDFSLFDQIVSEDNVELSYKQCMKGKCKYKSDAIIFDKNQTYNLKVLVNSLIDKTYEPSDYKKFYVYEPKQRLIYAPVFRDKLVQVMVNNVIKEIYKRKFIYDSYACLDNKGTHRAANRIQEFAYKSKLNYGSESYVIKIDINKYFYSIDRDILKNLLRKHIKCEHTLWLLDLIIDNSPNEKGLPLGNITSHLLANLYLNKLDQHCKRELSIKYYVRYMDDIILIVNNKEYAKYILRNIGRFLNDNLFLSLNSKKTKIFPLSSCKSNISQTINSVGYKIHPEYKLLRNDSKKRIKSKIKKFPCLIKSGKLTKEKAEQMLNSWYGHAMNCNSQNFIVKLLKRNSFLKLTAGSGLKLCILGCRK